MHFTREAATFPADAEPHQPQMRASASTPMHLYGFASTKVVCRSQKSISLFECALYFLHTLMSARCVHIPALYRKSGGWNWLSYTTLTHSLKGQRHYSDIPSDMSKPKKTPAIPRPSARLVISIVIHLPTLPAFRNLSLLVSEYAMSFTFDIFTHFSFARHKITLRILGGNLDVNTFSVSC